MSRSKAILNFLVLGILAATIAQAATSQQAAAQTGANLVQNRARPDLLLNVQGGQPLATPASRGATTAHWTIEPAGEAALCASETSAPAFNCTPRADACRSVPSSRIG
jgi:hypothetical protein